MLPYFSLPWTAAMPPSPASSTIPPLPIPRTPPMIIPDRMIYPPAVSLTYADGEERAALVRNALRSGERESKRVSYSEEISSGIVGEEHAALSLKLDYDDVVKAWSGGFLYTTQIVPDVTDGIFTSTNINVIGSYRGRARQDLPKLIKLARRAFLTLRQLFLESANLERRGRHTKI